MITKWEPARVKKMAIEAIMSRAGDVGKFVETEARRGLEAISTPDTPRDKNYRAFLSNQILTHKIEQRDKEIIIIVGMKNTVIYKSRKKGEKGKLQTKTGLNKYGFYVEIGSRKAPAHPYLRPAVFNNAREIVGMLGD